jgi:cell division septation protein DedD
MRLPLIRAGFPLAACGLAAACGGGLTPGAPRDAGSMHVEDVHVGPAPVSLREAIEGPSAPRAEPAAFAPSEPVAEPAPERPPSLLEAAAARAEAASAQPRPGASAAAAVPAPAGDAGVEGELTPTGVLFAVHLASYRTEATARRGWDALSPQPALAGLEARVERVDLGAEKGEFLRLKAGPLPNRGEAERRCAALMAEGLYCAVETHSGKALE